MESEEQTQETQLYVSPISDVMATEKLTTKLLQLVTKCLYYFNSSGQG